MMRGTFFLPADIAEGDRIEIGQLGAYGACPRTGFNGFDRARIAEIFESPSNSIATRGAALAA